MQYHSKGTDELSQKVVLIQLAAALVLIKHGKLQLLDLLKMVVHLELHSKHGVQIVHRCLCSAQLQPKYTHTYTHARTHTL